MKVRVREIKESIHVFVEDGEKMIDIIKFDKDIELERLTFLMAQWLKSLEILEASEV